jgi:hypothetical protein
MHAHPEASKTLSAFRKIGCGAMAAASMPNRPSSGSLQSEHYTAFLEQLGREAVTIA